MFQRLEAFLGTVAFPTSLPKKLPICLSRVPGRFSDPGDLNIPTGIAIARLGIA